MVLVFFYAAAYFPVNIRTLTSRWEDLYYVFGVTSPYFLLHYIPATDSLTNWSWCFRLLFGSRWIAWTTRNHLTVNFRLGRTLQQPVFIPVLLSDLIISVSDYSHNYMFVAIMWLVFHLLELCTSIWRVYLPKASSVSWIGIQFMAIKYQYVFYDTIKSIKYRPITEIRLWFWRLYYATLSITCFH